MNKIGKRILILGCPGSGKSTFAAKLHAATHLPLIHLDNIWWKKDKTHISKEEFLEKLEELVTENAWILDGNYNSSYEIRMKACDTIIVLDYTTQECLQGIAARVGKPRADMPWVEEKLDIELVELVKRFRTEQRPKLMSTLEKYNDRNILIFKNREQADQWMEEL